MENPLRYSPEGPDEVSAARELQALARAAHPRISDSVWRISSTAAGTLANWQVPVAVAAAALLAPLLSHRLMERAALLHKVSLPTIELAEQLVAWHASASRPPADPLQDSTVTQYGAALRHLFRQAYLDLPGMPWILLLMADHDARLYQYPAGEHLAQSLAAQTEKVFVPLAEMLGMWQLRRKWLDQIWRVLHPEEFREMDRWLGPPGYYTEAGFSAIASAVANGPATATGADGAAPSRNPFLQDKAQAYFKLKEALEQSARQAGLSAGLKISPIVTLPGSTLHHCKQLGKPKDELVSRLNMQITCASEQDCYLALGLVHALGKPVTQRYRERFDDYIALPQPSGYRALHTAIVYQGFRPAVDSTEQILVELRIHTAKMDRLNEWGLVEAAH
ncbi:MAG: hypothetical protein M1546_03565, partial [Chloroflexi bacterium]|nr:hypothetical protein [Chloroflexota bacterium]